MAELGNNDDPSKIYISPGILVHSDDLFSETTVSMLFKFHVQHDSPQGFKNDKTQPGPKFKQEGHEALNRSPEYTGQKSNI